LKPVIELAERGVIVTQNKKTSTATGKNGKINGSNSVLSKVYKENDVIKYPALANTLRRISKNGMEFYKGETAKTLVAYLKEKERLSRQAAKYEAKWRKSISFKYKDLNIISMAPSGGIFWQIFKMIEPYDLSKNGTEFSCSHPGHCRSRKKSLCRSLLFLGDLICENSLKSIDG
jgi:gamma-glutamyltranspeptidase/glutathione hydrolase